MATELYTLINTIISKITTLKQKLVKLNNYWQIEKTGSLSVTSNTGYSLTNGEFKIIGNILQITFDFTLASAVSDGTSIKKTIGTISFYDSSHELDWTQNPRTNTCILGFTGPVASLTLHSWSNDSSGSFSASINLNGVCGGQLKANTTYNARFLCPAARNLQV